MSPTASKLGYLISLLGIDPASVARDYDKRFRIQKSIRLLQLHPGIAPHVSYDFNFYVKGPYSPSLARDYYDPSVAVVTKFDLSASARNYLRFVSALGYQDLLLLATTAQVIQANPRANENTVASIVNGIKPQFGLDQVRSTYREVHGLQTKFGLTTNH